MAKLTFRYQGHRKTVWNVSVLRKYYTHVVLLRNLGKDECHPAKKISGIILSRVSKE